MSINPKSLASLIVGISTSVVLAAVVGWRVLAPTIAPAETPTPQNETEKVRQPIADNRPPSAFDCADNEKPAGPEAKEGQRLIQNDYLCLSFTQPTTWVAVMSEPSNDTPRGIDFGAPGPDGKNWAFAKLTPITDDAQYVSVTGYPREQLDFIIVEGKTTWDIADGGKITELYTHSDDGLYYHLPYWYRTYYLVEFTSPQRTYVLETTNHSSGIPANNSAALLEVIQQSQPY